MTSEAAAGGAVATSTPPRDAQTHRCAARRDARRRPATTTPSGGGHAFVRNSNPAARNASIASAAPTDDLRHARGRERARGRARAVGDGRSVTPATGGVGTAAGAVTRPARSQPSRAAPRRR
jgi:hypothetical protein